MVKIMSGVLFPDEGEIRHLGRIVTLRDARDAAAIGVQTVYQDLALCNNLGTIQNLFLGREIARPWYRGGRLIMAAMESRARQVLGELGVVIPDLGVAVGSLSGGQRQSNAICRAVLWDARVVILDEPTAALGVKQRRQVLEVIKRLRAENIGVVVVSHDLVEVRSIADRVVVLRLGRNVAEMRAGDATHEAIVAAITGGGGDPAPASAGTQPVKPSFSLEAPHAAARRGQLLELLAGRWRVVPVLIALVGIWIFFSVQSDVFLSSRNLSNLALQIVVMSVIGLALVLVLLVGEIDLSVAYLSAVCAAIAATLSVRLGWPFALALAGGVGAGALWGLGQGLVTTRFRVPSFIVTLGASLILTGVLQKLLPSDTYEIGLVNDPIALIANAFLPSWLSFVGVAAAVVVVGSAQAADVPSTPSARFQVRP